MSLLAEVPKGGVVNRSGGIFPRSLSQPHFRHSSTSLSAGLRFSFSLSNVRGFTVAPDRPLLSLSRSLIRVLRYAAFPYQVLMDPLKALPTIGKLADYFATETFAVRLISRVR